MVSIQKTTSPLFVIIELFNKLTFCLNKSKSCNIHLSVPRKSAHPEFFLINHSNY